MNDVRTRGTDPVEYFVDLFERHKIVVFAETFHPEMTQYEFLMQVLRHPRFQARVRAVFTEIGSRSQQDPMDAFLSAREMRRDPLLTINRNNVIHPEGWPNENILLFWEELWRVNSRLSPEMRIRACLSDIAWDWSALRSPDDYRRRMAQPDVADRDRAMADLIRDTVRKTERAPESGARDRYLVIMNTRHATGTARRASDGSPDRSVGRFLKEDFGADQVWCVLYHQPRMRVSDAERQDGPALIEDGKWDAAFHLDGNRPAGFDLAGTAFGDAPFDYLSVLAANRYSDVFDGLVFWRPLHAFYKYELAADLFRDDAFLAETERRCVVAGRKPMMRKLRERLGEFFFALGTTRSGLGISEAEVRMRFGKWIR
ncbi:MAG: hypothetical protein HYY17_11525 [Planctomycetes bacterium]|nr:hypothetical protein [Planctomycetota bacterium]